MASLISDANLAQVLDTADADDLVVLIEYITDRGDGRISLSSNACKMMTEAKASGVINNEIRALIAEELHRFGGNSLFNLFRGGAGAPYREILCDVASHVKAEVELSSSCADIELAVLEALLTQSLGKMTEQEKADLFAEFSSTYVPGSGPAVAATLIVAARASGFGVYKFTVIVANAVAKAILGRGLAFGATTSVMRSMSMLTGPIGWAITAIWTIFDLGSPAYRVTVPCVIQIAYMRQKAMYRSCPNCGASSDAGRKFCGDCGSPLFPRLARGEVGGI